MAEPATAVEVIRATPEFHDGNISIAQTVEYWNEKYAKALDTLGKIESNWTEDLKLSGELSKVDGVAYIELQLGTKFFSFRIGTYDPEHVFQDIKLDPGWNFQGLTTLKSRIANERDSVSWLELQVRSFPFWLLSPKKLGMNSDYMTKQEIEAILKKYLEQGGKTGIEDKRFKEVRLARLQEFTITAAPGTRERAEYDRKLMQAEYQRMLEHGDEMGFPRWFSHVGIFMLPAEVNPNPVGGFDNIMIIMSAKGGQHMKMQPINGYCRPVMPHYRPAMGSSEWLQGRTEYHLN